LKRIGELPLDEITCVTGGAIGAVTAEIELKSRSAAASAGGSSRKAKGEVEVADQIGGTTI